MWKENAAAYFKDLFQKLPEGIEKNHRKPHLDSRHPGENRTRNPESATQGY
jgi:hypothetical protein